VTKGAEDVAKTAVDDGEEVIDAAAESAKITTEPWGVRRFLVRAPDGNVINIVRHRD
jgi:hypothetical protein